MKRPLLTLLLASLVLAAALAVARRQQPVSPEPARKLRVCADPNNLPFSNERLDGFENKIADLLAREMKATVEYTWWAQRRGFIRNTLKAGICDVVIGVPSQFELAAVTRPYYRSSYVFLSRKDSRQSYRSLDDPILRKVKIGVHLIGDDYSNTPPVHALANRNIVRNVAGYTIYGDYRKESPPSALVDAVVNREVDVAIVWGPLAGYHSRNRSVPLEVTPVQPEADLPSLPFVFDISMGVRPGDEALRAELQELIDRKYTDIRRILSDYGVPVLPAGRRGAGS